MKKKLFAIIFGYLIAVVLIINSLTGSFGANLILQAGLPFAFNERAAFNSRLLIALAMPSFSGAWGNYTAIAKDGYRTLKHNWRVDFEVVTAEDGRPEARSVVVLPKLPPRKDAKRRK